MRHPHGRAGQMSAVLWQAREPLHKGQAKADEDGP